MDLWRVSLSFAAQDGDTMEKLLESAGSLGHAEWLWEKADDFGGDLARAGALGDEITLSRIDAFFPGDLSRDRLQAIFTLAGELLGEPRGYEWNIHFIGSDDYEKIFEQQFDPYFMAPDLLVIGPWESARLGRKARDARSFGDDFPAQTRCVIIRPGMAFGTGRHETTRLCVAWLAGQKLAGQTVLDMGCGSGILAIYAALAGARVTGVDIAREAVANARENWELNLALHNTPEGTITGSAEWHLGDFRHPAARQGGLNIYIGNLTAAVLEANLEAVRDSGAPRGIFSGILRKFWPALESAMLAAGFSIVLIREENEWLLVEWTLGSSPRV